jgi:hypothetical protein
MDLLFKREQTPGRLARVQFKLWSKIELDEEEQALVSRYKFDEAVLIAALEPGLFRRAAVVALVSTLVALALLFRWGDGLGIILAVIIGPGIGYNYFNNKRETIFVRDLLHGRHFACSSVVELARKEAWLETVVGFLRQVMESAKHWDGTEHLKVEGLPKDEARQVILKGI